MKAQALNRHLRRLPDGAQAVSVELALWTGVRREIGNAIYVYWPFVVFRQQPPPIWNVTHAPSGSYVHATRTKGEAVAFTKRLREAGDWDFVSPRGQKAKRAKDAARDFYPKLVAIS